MLIILFGIQSKGKSSLIDFLIGCDVSYKKAGEGTKQPVHFHVYKSTGPSTVLYWGFDALPPAGTPGLNQAEFRKKMESYMDTAVMSSTPLHVVVSTPNPIFEGTLVDCPGWLQGGLLVTPEPPAKKAITMDILETAALSAHDLSVFIAVESVSTSSADFTSLVQEMNAYFQVFTLRSSATFTFRLF